MEVNYLVNQIKWIFFFYIFLFRSDIAIFIKYSMNSNYVICMIYFMNNNDVCIEKFSGFGSNKETMNFLNIFVSLKFL